MATTSEECLWKARFRLGVGKLSLCGKFVIYLYFNSELVSVFIFLAMRVKAHWHWELRSEVSWNSISCQMSMSSSTFFNESKTLSPPKNPQHDDCCMSGSFQGPPTTWQNVVGWLCRGRKRGDLKRGGCWIHVWIPFLFHLGELRELVFPRFSSKCLEHFEIPLGITRHHVALHQISLHCIAYIHIYIHTYLYYLPHLMTNSELGWILNKTGSMCKKRSPVQVN